MRVDTPGETLREQGLGGEFSLEVQGSGKNESIVPRTCHDSSALVYNATNLK